jgi:hypothetical protein
MRQLLKHDLVKMCHRDTAFSAPHTSSNDVLLPAENMCMRPPPQQRLRMARLPPTATRVFLKPILDNSEKWGVGFFRLSAGVYLP